MKAKCFPVCKIDTDTDLEQALEETMRLCSTCQEERKARDVKLREDIKAVLKKERNRIQQRTYITTNQRQFQWLVVDELERDLSKALLLVEEAPDRNNERFEPPNEAQKKELRGWKEEAKTKNAI